MFMKIYKVKKFEFFKLKIYVKIIYVKIIFFNNVPIKNFGGPAVLKKDYMG